MNRFTCQLALPFYFFFITTDFQVVLSQLLFYSVKTSCCCSLSRPVRLGTCGVLSWYWRQNLFLCWFWFSVVASLQGFARASSHLEQVNSSMQPPQGQRCRWPGGSLPGLTDQTGTLEEV